MPTIAVKKRLLDKHLGESYNRDDIDSLCFLYGLEVDDVITEKDEMTGVVEEVYKIEIPANRYDLLCVEGLTRALLIFQRKMKTPRYKVLEVKDIQKIVVEPETASVRPYAAGAILRRVRLDKDSYASFVDLQDKLHQNICRKRSLVLISINDLDLMPTEFVLETTNIFVQCTGNDLKKLEIVVDTIVTMFSQYSSTPFSVEPVQVVYQDKRIPDMTYPVLKYHEMKVNCASMNKKIGKEFTNKETIELLAKMCIDCSPVAGSDSELKVTIPPTRHDILHECDVAEDIALANGFNNITVNHSQSHTIAQPLPMNKLTDQLRQEVASCGWTEVLNFSLCSIEDISSKLRKDATELANAVKISNPKTLEFQVVRKRLLPGILKTLSHNRDLPLPLKLFEIQDVVFIDASKDTGCRNERHLAAVQYSKSGGFEIIHGLLDRVMEVLDIPLKSHSGDLGYSISEDNDSIFFEGRCGRVDYNGKRIGEFGVIHPEVLTNFSLSMPCSYLEMNIEPFL